MVSAVCRIPPEVVSRVIRYLCGGVLRLEGRRELTDLSLVCKGWRCAALLSQELWKGIHIEPNQCNGDHAFERIVSWFERSGKLRKTLEFDVGHENRCSCDPEDYDEYSGCNLAAMGSTWDRLLTEGPPLHHLSFRCTRPVCFRKLLVQIGIFCNDDRPHPPIWNTIRSFELNFNTDAKKVAWDDHHQEEESLFLWLPPVTSFSLILPSSSTIFDTRNGALYTHVNIPPRVLTNLTSFNIQCDWEANHVLGFLQDCTSLERLEVTIDTNSDRPYELDADDSEESYIYLPKLRSLRLRQLHNVEILKFLKTPSLVNLDLEFKDSNRTTKPMPQFNSTFRRFLKPFALGLSFRSLSLKNLYLEPEDLAETLLLHIPLLQRLTINNMPNVLEPLFQSLKAHFDKQPRRFLGPMPAMAILQELNLVATPTDFDFRVVSQFINSMKPVLRLSWTLSYLNHDLSFQLPAAKEIMSATKSRVWVDVIRDEED